MVFLLDTRESDRNDDVEPPMESPLPTPASEDQLYAAIEALAPPPADVIAPELGEFTPPDEPSSVVKESDAISYDKVPTTIAMSDAEKAALTRRLERFAEESLEAFREEVSWQQDGRQYSAVLIREPANNGTALEHVIARVSTSNRGKHLTTMVSLRRLALSHFTQMVDFWNPMVQLHDDEIVGRFHSNSQLKLLYDSRTAPKFLGKVTTAARSFDMESHGRKRDSDIFRGGRETRTGRIELPESVQPFEWAPKVVGARNHEFTNDTHIRFFRDGSYTWRTRESTESEFNRPSEHPVYFVAGPQTTLYVQGVVAGTVLIYSPQRIVIEGSLTYARDPRDIPDSADYLGLVSNKFVEVAPPRVTGPGDLEIHAAIFAGRRFVVTNIDHPRSATLRIYGVLRPDRSLRPSRVTPRKLSTTAVSSTSARQAFRPPIATRPLTGTANGSRRRN